MHRDTLMPPARIDCSQLRREALSNQYFGQTIGMMSSLWQPGRGFSFDSMA
jgi:hypothetical protein